MYRMSTIYSPLPHQGEYGVLRVIQVIRAIRVLRVNRVIRVIRAIRVSRDIRVHTVSEPSTAACVNIKDWVHDRLSHTNIKDWDYETAVSYKHQGLGP